tara:strand:+ start:157 stop:495 length:339 start_codon:yes stop_codon:yes gene_type:complete
MTQAQTGEYTAKDIQVLEGLEAVRVRPGMYIGSTDQRGLHHLIYEILDNAVDEAMAGYCERVDISISEDGWITVVDNGRGIPIDKHAKDRQERSGNCDDNLARRRKIRRWRL